MCNFDKANGTICRLVAYLMRSRLALDKAATHMLPVNELSTIQFVMQGYGMHKVQPQSVVILVMQAAQLYRGNRLHHIKGSSKLANSHLVDVGKASQCMFCQCKRLCPCLSLPPRPGDLPEENFLLLHHSPKKQASPSLRMNWLRRLASMLHVYLVKL